MGHLSMSYLDTEKYEYNFFHDNNYSDISGAQQAIHQIQAIYIINKKDNFAWV